MTSDGLTVRKGEGSPGDFPRGLAGAFLGEQGDGGGGGGDLGSEVADPGQAEVGEGGDGGGELAEDVVEVVGRGGGAGARGGRAWRTASARSRSTSQSSRASAGGSMARLRRWRRPVTLTIEPCFSANPAVGRTTSAAPGVGPASRAVTARKSSRARSAAVKPASAVSSSPRQTRALSVPARTSARMAARPAEGSAVCHTRAAPVVFGLRSAATSRPSGSPRRGTSASRVVPSTAARRRARNSSSLVIRPEAITAVRSPGKRARPVAAALMAAGHGTGAAGVPGPPRASGWVRRRGSSRWWNASRWESGIHHEFTASLGRGVIR